MIEPFMTTFHFQCPACEKIGIGVKPRGAQDYNISEGFQVEERGTEQVILCECGAMALPKEKSD